MDWLHFSVSGESSFSEDSQRLWLPTTCRHWRSENCPLPQRQLAVLSGFGNLPFCLLIQEERKVTRRHSRILPSAALACSSCSSWNLLVGVGGCRDHSILMKSPLTLSRWLSCWDLLLSQVSSHSIWLHLSLCVCIYHAEKATWEHHMALKPQRLPQEHTSGKPTPPKSTQTPTTTENQECSRA